MSFDPLNFSKPIPTSYQSNWKKKKKKKKKKKQKNTSGKYDRKKLKRVYDEFFDKFGDLWEILDADYVSKPTNESKQKDTSPPSGKSETQTMLLFFETLARQDFKNPLFLDVFPTVLKNIWNPPRILEFMRWMWYFDVSILIMEKKEGDYHTLRPAVVKLMENGMLFRYMVYPDWVMSAGDIEYGMVYSNTSQHYISKYNLETDHYVNIFLHFRFHLVNFQNFFYRKLKGKDELTKVFHIQMKRIQTIIVPNFVRWIHIKLFNKNPLGELSDSGYIEYVSTPSDDLRGEFRPLYTKFPTRMTDKELHNTFIVLKKSMSLYHIWAFIAELLPYQNFYALINIAFGGFIDNTIENQFEFAVYKVFIPMLKEFKKTYTFSDEPHRHYKYVKTWVFEYIWHSIDKARYSNTVPYYKNIENMYEEDWSWDYNFKDHLRTVTPDAENAMSMLIDIVKVIDEPVKISSLFYRRLFLFSNDYSYSDAVSYIISIAKIMTVKPFFEKLLSGGVVVLEDNEIIDYVNESNLTKFKDTYQLKRKKIERVTGGRMIYPEDFKIFKPLDEEEEERLTEKKKTRKKKETKRKKRKELREMRDKTEMLMRKRLGGGMSDQDWREFIESKEVSSSRKELLGKRSLFQRERKRMEFLVRERKRMESLLGKRYTDYEWGEIVRMFPNYFNLISK